MAMHVVGMGNGRCHAHINSRFFESFFGAAEVFQSVGIIVMRGEIVRNQRESGSVERDRVHAADLAMRYGRTFIRQTPLNPQPRVIRIFP